MNGYVKFRQEKYCTFYRGANNSVPYLFKVKSGLILPLGQQTAGSKILAGWI